VHSQLQPHRGRPARALRPWPGTGAAVDGFDLVVAPGTRCGLVGESGSGKSSIVRSILRLIRPPHRARADRILIEGVGDVSQMTPRRLREIRGGAIVTTGCSAPKGFCPT
jgi:ABC-type dipeptide/oligopeptide/nickel transport system ATPase component